MKSAETLHWEEVERRCRLETKEIAKTATLTPKQFREFLNAEYGFQGGHDGSNNTGWNGQSGARTRAYGDWLYNSDRGMFNENYSRYMRDGKLE